MTSKGERGLDHKAAINNRVNYKLRIEMVPGDLWGKNLRSNEVGLGKARWDKLRRGLIVEHGARCAICESSNKLHGHEVWSYRSTARACIAKLIKIEIVCLNCHDIHHWGRTYALIRSGIVSQRRHSELRRHFCRVNNCRVAEFEKHVISRRRKWIEQSMRKWKIDWGVFGPAIKEAQAARKAWRQQRQPVHRTGK